MKGRDLGKLLLINLRNHKLRTLLTIITMIILLSSMLFILITVDLYLDYEEKILLNEVNARSLRVSISQVDSKTIDINSSIVEQLKEQGYDCKSDLYNHSVTYMYDEEMGIYVDIRTFEELTICNGAKIINNDVAINAYYVSEDLYDLLNSYLGYDIGDNYSESIYTEDGYHIELDGVIAGEVESGNGYSVYVNVNNFIDWRLISGVDVTIEHDDEFLNLKSIKENINSVLSIIDEFNYKKADGEYVISYNVKGKYDNYISTQVWMYVSDFCLIMLLFIICVKYVVNSLIITINENSKMYALLKVVGLQKRHIFIIVMFEAMFIMLLAMIVSTGITYLLSGAIIGVNALLFNVIVATFYVDWKIPLLLFLAIFALLSLSVGIKIKKENDNKILDVLKSE